MRELTLMSQRVASNETMTSTFVAAAAKNAATTSTAVDAQAMADTILRQLLPVLQRDMAACLW